MGRFQSCKAVVERSLRRAFYDGVLELYEGHGSPETVTAVTLEGTLTLTINRAETLLIRLNEVAQRAEEISVDQDDSGHASQEQDHVRILDKELSGKKRKREAADDNEDRRTAIKKKLKTEILAKETKREIVPSEQSAKSDEAEKDLSGSQPVTGERSASGKSKSVKLKTESGTQMVAIKTEPQDTPVDCTSDAFPGPFSAPSVDSATSLDLTFGGKAELGDWSEYSPRGIDLSVSVRVKKEPTVESILIEDDDEDDDDDNDCEDLSRRSHSSRTVQQASPIHSLWHKRPDRPRHLSSSQHGPHSREHSLRSYPSPHRMDASDLHQMSVLLERNDCPMCGEVLHTRKELSTHLHAHRHTLRTACSVCRTNTLTLDALLLHLGTIHSPRVLPLTPPSITPDSLLSQALVPALPYPPPMSAIASLVSMAACQAGPSTGGVAFLSGGPGGLAGGGVTSLMEHLMTYRGLLPCPVCQLLCSGKQHLAAHLALAGFGGGEEEEEEATEDVKSESRRQNSDDGEGSSNFSCFDCSMGFGSQAAFTQHCMLQHNATSAVSQGSCSVCHRAFHTWKALHAHYLSAHAIANFCERCKMGFVSTAELKTHYDSTHSADTRSLAFVCDICNKGFYSQSQCSAHKRSHTSEKSFACQVCGSAFFKRGDLSKHFRTVHAPNRVFACRFCGKRGTRMDNMRSHVKSHGKHMTRDEVLSFIEEVSPN
ncbi:hypothetical protein ACOMHN_017182 [Nucella lapillus]